jgi:DUF4097 and DUF4098 domain-containing protein YvlB
MPGVEKQETERDKIRPRQSNEQVKVRRHMKRSIFSISILFLTAIPGRAQAPQSPKPSLNCDHADHNDRLVSHCEMREQAMPSGGRITIDGLTNGGISVKGWTRNDILVRAQVRTAAPSESEATLLAGQVFLQAAAGRIAASGPAASDNSRWSVSYEVFVPHQSDLSLTTHNGGISLSDIHGQIEFQAHNGGIHLARLAGNVKGGTQNGGLHIELAGNRWDGQGLEVRSVNGGVHLTMPPNYSAHLEAGTTNGRVSSDIPELATPNEKRPKQIGVSLGNGGPTIRVITTNGGVHIAHS